MFDNLRADIRRLEEIKTKGYPWNVLESLLFENGFQAVVLHRMAHWFRRRSIPFIPPLIHQLSLKLTAADISPLAEIGPGLRLSHGTGVVIGAWVKIGARAHILQQVTLGARTDERRREMPTIGDDVLIGTAASIIGGVHVGDGAMIGVGATVTRDVPAGHKLIVKQEHRLIPPAEDAGTTPAPSAAPAETEVD